MTTDNTDKQNGADPSEDRGSLANPDETLAYVPGDTGLRETEPDLSAAAGRQFGDYELLEELGRGGMGIVYKAKQISINRIVAVKMILAGRLASRSDIDRFYVEAKAAGRLSHPHIVDVFQAGEIDGHHFFSMEYVPGTDLAKLAQQRELPAARVAQYLKTVAEAVHYAHENGVLHRDLKPSNVLIDSNDQPRITDFGLAKDVQSQQHLTSTGAALGTPSYMSPEQAQAKHESVDRRTDVYSLGAILYELLTGQRPFRAESIVGTILDVIHTDPTPPSTLNPICDRDLEAICLKCLEKTPHKRYASAQELAADLQRFLDGQQVRARRVTAARRIWNWTRSVPLIAAVTGRRTTGSTAWHVRAQWAVVLLAMMLVGAIICRPWVVARARLRVIDIGAGARTGTYFRIATRLGAALSKDGRVEVHESQGSVDSFERLRQGKLDLALLQENSIRSASDIEVLAPLYYEVTLVLVRQGSSIQGVPDLEGRAVALGGRLSGMRLSALRLLEHFRVQAGNLRRTESNFRDLMTDPDLEAAVVTIKVDDPELRSVLASGQFRLLPIRHAEQIPGFSDFVVYPEDLRDLDIPPAGIATGATLAILAVRSDTPDWLITRCLEALYGRDEISRRGGLMSVQRAAECQALNLHRASQRFFSRAVPDSRP